MFRVKEIPFLLLMIGALAAVAFDGVGLPFVQATLLLTTEVSESNNSGEQEEEKEKAPRSELISSRLSADRRQPNSPWTASSDRLGGDALYAVPCLAASRHRLSNGILAPMRT